MRHRRTFVPLVTMAPALAASAPFDNMILRVGGDRVQVIKSSNGRVAQAGRSISGGGL